MFSSARPYLKGAVGLSAVLALFLGFNRTANAGVNWVGVPPNPNVLMVFEDPNNWDALDYDPNIHDPPPTGPELEPPGVDSTWFIEDINGQILFSVPRDGTNGTTNAKIGGFAIGGGNSEQIQTLHIRANMTLTGLERLTNEFLGDPNDMIPDPTFGDIRAARRETRVGRQDTTPYFVPTSPGTLDGVPQVGQGTVNSSVVGYDKFPWGVVKHSTGYVNFEYELADPNTQFPLPEGSNADIKLSADKDYSAGSLWEVSGNAKERISSDVQIGNKRVVSPGEVFRVVGSGVQKIEVGARFSVVSMSAAWDATGITSTPNVAEVGRMNRGKGIVEFVLDSGGVTPIEISDTLNIGGSVPLPNFDEVIVPGFLRIKLMEPTTAGSGTSQLVLFRSDRISSSITTGVLPATSQTQQGIFFDPDRQGTASQPNRPIVRDTDTGTPGDQYAKVFADYAGVQYSWDIIYTDDVLVAGDDVIVDSVVLTNLQITGGIQGDFNDANGLDLADLNALKGAIGSISYLQSLQNTQNVGNVNLSQPIYDLDGDGLITNSDLDLWITHPDFKNTNYGDVDLDGDVDSADLNVIMTQYGINSGAGWADGDTDMDGDVDGIDFLIWQRNYTGPGVLQALATVPEPASALLMSLGLMAVAARRRR